MRMEIPLGHFLTEHYLDLLDMGEPGLEEAHAVLEKDEGITLLGFLQGCGL